MENFVYKMISGKLYLSIDNDRMLILWDRRWVPAYAQIIEEGGGEIDPENPEIVDFNEGTEVLPPDPEHPNDSVLSLGPGMAIEDNTLLLGGE